MFTRASTGFTRADPSRRWFARAHLIPARANKLQEHFCKQKLAPSSDHKPCSSEQVSSSDPNRQKPARSSDHEPRLSEQVSAWTRTVQKTAFSLDNSDSFSLATLYTFIIFSTLLLTFWTFQLSIQPITTPSTIHTSTFPIIHPS